MGRARRALWATGTVLAVAALGAGYVAANVRDLVPGPFTTAEPWAQASPFPTPTLPVALPTPTVLAAWSPTAQVPTADGLAPGIDGLRSASELGTPPGVVVVDVATGEKLAGADQAAGRIPASTTKVLTGAAAVATLDLDATLPTTAVLAGADEVYLVGGGDMALAAGSGDPAAVVGHAGLGDLADQTVDALQARGVTSVVLRFDDTLFERQAQARGWGPVDFSGGHVAAIQAIGIDIGKLPDRTPRDTDPSGTAAATFAQALRDRGIEVREGPSRAAAPDGTAELGRVDSARLGDLLDFAMAESSNTLTEVFGRLVAIAAGEPATFEGATAGVLHAIANLGVDVSGTTLTDTSGLSSLNRISPQLLADVLVASATDPAMRPLAVALPVAGLEGTLSDRWVEDGLVRAKTGTLQGVVTLAGYVPTADGRLLAFAVMADGVPYAGNYLARLTIDTWVNSLAACGCS